jgi:hypothetical protein
VWGFEVRRAPLNDVLENEMLLRAGSTLGTDGIEYDNDVLNVAFEQL